MLKNFLIVSLRTLIYQPLYTFISMFGLTIGLTACLFAGLYIAEELSYDGYHNKGEHIYRLAVERKYPDHTTFYASIPSSFASTLKAELPEVEATLRLYKSFEDVSVSIGENKWKESKVLFADSTFFDMFSIPLLEGDVNTVLKEINSIVLTQSTAYRYFGKGPAVGKTISTDVGNFIVKGVCQDVPRLSHFSFDLLGSWQSVKFPIKEPNFLFFNAYTYIRISPHTSLSSIEEKIRNVTDKYAAGGIQRHLGIDYTAYKKAGNGYRYFLQPLKRIHLHSALEGELQTNGSYLYLLSFGLIASLLLTIALLNYINLSTARSLSRVKEVGVRKVLGAKKIELIFQFMTEALLLSCMAGLLAILILWLSLPLINQLWEIPLLVAQPQPVLILWGIMLAIITGLLGGGYPAFATASLPMILSSKIMFGTTLRKALGRNLLVGFQFFISTCLLMATMVIFKQVTFLQEKELGFTKENVLVLSGIEQLTNNNVDKRPAFKDLLLQLPEVQSVSFGNPVPGEASFGFQVKSHGSQEVMTCRGMIMDEDMEQTLELHLLAGRSFSRQFNNSYSLLINQKAAQVLGMQEAVGKKLQLVSSESDSSENELYTVSGVIKDFHIQPFNKAIEPLVIIHTSNPIAHTPYAFVKINRSSQNKDLLELIERKWKTLTNGESMSSFYLEAFWHSLLSTERNYRRLFTLFTILTLSLACMGLFGLSAYLMKRRQKEVSIRMILGASKKDMFVLLSKNFLTLALLSFLFALPVSVYGSQRWLSTFAYHITLGAEMFIVAGVIMWTLGLSTILYHLIIIMYINPIQSLKEE